jgi:hypothetical protein
VITRPAAASGRVSNSGGRVSLVHADGQDEAVQEPTGNGFDAKQLTGGFSEGSGPG